jgi:hypothetical protein
MKPVTAKNELIMVYDDEDNELFALDLNCDDVSGVEFKEGKWYRLQCKIDFTGKSTKISYDIFEAGRDESLGNVKMSSTYKAKNISKVELSSDHQSIVCLC